MAKKLRDEEMRFTVVVNGKEGQKAITDLERANKKLASSNDSLLAKQKKLEKQGKKNTDAWHKNQLEIDSNTKSMSKNKDKMEDLKKEMGLSELTMRQLKATSKKLRNELEDLNPNDAGFNDFTTQLKAVNERMYELKGQTMASGDAIEQLEKHSGALSDLWVGMSTGHIPTLQKGLKGVAGNIKGITKAALSFIATPIGAAIAVFAGIALATKKWIDFNIEVEKTNKLVRDLTQESGMAVDAIRVRAEVLQETFGTEMQESITAAKSLVKGLGISYDEAFDIIEDGGIRGKLRNDEFLDSLREYPLLFKQGGFSAKEFADIVSAGIDLSIYSDKLPDAIKEFTLSITEGTDAARDALINAFGKEFTDKLFKDIKSGAKTPKEALALISAEAKKIGLNAQQAQLLTADLFKGAGEDAGGALKIFEAVNMALNDQKKPLTEIQQIQADQLEQTKKLEGIYTGLFATADGGFGKIIAKGKIFGTKVLIKILESGVAVYNWFIDLNNQSGLFSSAMTGIGEIVKSSFSVIGSIIKYTATAFSGLGDVIIGAFTLDGDKIKEGYANVLGGVDQLFEEVSKTATKAADNIYDAFNGKKKYEKLSLDDLVAGGGSVSTTVTDPKNNNNRLSTSEDDKLLKQKEKLLKEILKLEEAAVLEKLDINEREIQAIENKYAKLLDLAVAGSDEESKLKTLKQAEIDAKKVEQEELFQEEKRKIIESYDLLSDSEKQANDIAVIKSFYDKQLISLEDFEKAKEAIRLGYKEKKEKEGQDDKDEKLEKINEEFELKLENDALTDGQRHDLELERLDALLAAKLISQEQYEKKTADLANKSMVSRLQKAGAVINAISNFVNAAKKSELDSIKEVTKQKGESEESFLKRKKVVEDKKKAINKKYAKAEMLTSIAKIGVNTALAIMQAYAQMGPIGGTIAAAFIGGLGILQTVNAKKEYDKVQGYEKGKYKQGKRQITRTDGKKFNAAVKPFAFTQTVTQPTYFQDSNILTAEAGPELIVDSPTFRNLRPEVIDEIYNTRNRVHGFESGKYQSNTTESPDNDELLASINVMNQTNMQLLERLNNPIPSIAVYDDDEVQVIKSKQNEVEQARQGAIVGQ